MSSLAVAQVDDVCRNNCNDLLRIQQRQPLCGAKTEPKSQTERVRRLGHHANLPVSVS
jgi:hypothetical protein